MINTNSYIKQRYYEIGEELLKKELIPEIPPVVLTKANRFWGKIRRWKKDMALVDIRLSYSLFSNLYQTKGEVEFKNQLDSTICHEFAHIKFWEHGPNHSGLTLDYLSTISKVDTYKPQIATAALSNNLISLSDLVDNPTQARNKLRKAGIQKPGARWE